MQILVRIVSVLLLAIPFGFSICVYSDDSSEFDALPPAVSAIRYAEETYEEARDRALKELGRVGSWVADGVSAQAAALPYSKFALGRLPGWEGVQAVQSEFARVRDLRLFRSPHDPAFPRRVPWLYPDDGCFVRAQSVVELVSGNRPALKKVFAFGGFTMSTPYSSQKQVSWWYHVAAAVRVGRQAFVFDPTVEPRSALRIGDWIARMGARPAQVKIAVCNKSAYDPFSSCEGGSDASTRAAAQRDRPIYLQAEWNRLISLGYDASRVLGISPPWAT